MILNTTNGKTTHKQPLVPLSTTQVKKYKSLHLKTQLKLIAQKIFQNVWSAWHFKPLVSQLTTSIDTMF
jgi:hypothetical protein